MNRENAVKINSHVESMISLANQILYIANHADDVESQKTIKRALANVVTDLDLDILEPIYKQFPDLRPPEMEEIKCT